MLARYGVIFFLDQFFSQRTGILFRDIIETRAGAAHQLYFLSDCLGHLLVLRRSGIESELHTIVAGPVVKLALPPARAKAIPGEICRCAYSNRAHGHRAAETGLHPVFLAVLQALSA